MKKKRTARGRVSGTTILLMLRAALLACIATAALMLLFAFLLKWEWLGVDAIRVCNTIIKTLCACFAGYLCSRFFSGTHALYAGISGMIYIVLSYVIFCLIEQDFALRWSLLSDIALCFIAAMTAAVVRNTIKNAGAAA